MRTTRAVPLAAFLLLYAADLRAQVVVGRLLDELTRAPVSAVRLRLLRGAERVAETSADSAGRFSLRAPAAGSYRITTSRIGYADATSAEVELQAEQTISLELLLSAEAVKIAPLVAEAARDPYLLTSGFYERMRSGGGFYLDEGDIQRRPGSTLVDLLRTTRGVRIQRVNTRQEIYLTSPTCLPQVVLDGVMVRWGGRSTGTMQPFEDIVQVPHIAAIEIYRAFQGVPTQYVGPNANCGTILIWTRHK